MIINTDIIIIIIISSSSSSSSPSRLSNRALARDAALLITIMYPIGIPLMFDIAWTLAYCAFTAFNSWPVRNPIHVHRQGTSDADVKVQPLHSP